MDRLREQRVVVANFGALPFEFPPPAGYRAFDVAETAGAPVGKPVAFHGPEETIAGAEQAQWIRRYWEWARSFPPAANPSADKNGSRCGYGQSGPVWFLTGSFESGPIRRECEVPAGRVILVPIVNVLAQAKPGSDLDCGSLTGSLRQFASDIADMRLNANGASVDNIARHLRETGCFDLRDAATGQTGLAAGTGYFVFLKPLDKGTHEIAFGARFKTDGFTQDVRYRLHVR